VLAALVRRGIQGTGARVDVSLLESALDFQFEVLTTHFNDGGKPPQRSAVSNAHAYLGAPYGIYATQDGYLALAMGSLQTLAQALDCAALLPYLARSCWFTQRDRIKAILQEHLRNQTTQYWLDRLVPVDYWCAPVMQWSELLQHEGFRTLDFVQEVVRDSGATVRTTRCPIRFDGRRPDSPLAAPRIGEHNDWVDSRYLSS
jgi:crotonobetainyl-CoA:carnitine CoA-transferase CaiB-like acyl-CoA transferase